MVRCKDPSRDLLDTVAGEDQSLQLGEQLETANGGADVLEAETHRTQRNKILVARAIHICVGTVKIDSNVLGEEG